ncbi:Mor transcription activator family protein [Thiothrix nivea]|uniref:Mor transcription activator domain protein n=1 Tax=Thiothrix nivea (strain ATCC 35100 / DSM 5205 / JP2) TaxID=870187 RepID=A0A656HD19_THINJ|nr:Mor transcription activator family protein [Thiothrix nivea]EIJ33346.1 Mor transcription activator domain protein [Thiothrix nivea DSM 5205]
MSSYDHLPEVARELIGLIGYDNTILIMRRWGGTYLDVPKDPERAMVLQEVLPYPAVVALCAYYNGERIRYIPKMDGVLRKMRNDEIRRDFGKVGVRHLATQHRLSCRAIYNIIAETEQERQASLFL